MLGAPHTLEGQATTSCAKECSEEKELALSKHATRAHLRTGMHTGTCRNMHASLLMHI